MATNEAIENIASKYNIGDRTLLSDKIYSVEGECIFEGLYNNLNITENNEEPTEMIDFEELIDLTLTSVDKKSIQDIKEFESVLNSFKTSKDIITDVNETPNLDEVNYYFEKIITENSSLNIQNVPIIENRQFTDIKTEDININNNSNIKLETPNNDADIFIDLTENADVSSKDIKHDIISISSEDDTQSIASDGYHSSDFEFITETEAQMDGYVINFSRIKSINSTDDIYQQVKLKCISRDADKTISHVNKDLNNTIFNPAQGSRTFNKQVDIDSNSSLTSPEGLESKISEAGRNGNVSDLGEGPSGLNRPIYDYSNKDYRQNHLIPEGEGYLDLFQGPYNPVLPMADIIILENKSIRPSPMNIQYEGIGFDKQLIWRKCQPDSSEDEYEDEAKESIEKILFMYPDNNRKPRRKRHTEDSFKLCPLLGEHPETANSSLPVSALEARGKLVAKTQAGPGRIAENYAGAPYSRNKRGPQKRLLIK